MVRGMYKDEYKNGPQHGTVGFQDSPMVDDRVAAAKHEPPMNEQARMESDNLQGVKVRPRSNPTERD